MLGDLLSRLDDPANAADALLALGDLTLMAGVRLAAEERGEHVGDYLVERIGHFTAHAGPDDWLALMTTINKAENPAAACLRRMLESI